MAREKYDPDLSARCDAAAEAVEALLGLPEESVATEGQRGIVLTLAQAEALIALAQKGFYGA
jgi:hypothetical protein